jgi:hypothetical protein
MLVLGIVDRKQLRSSGARWALLVLSFLAAGLLVGSAAPALGAGLSVGLDSMPVDSVNRARPGFTNKLLFIVTHGPPCGDGVTGAECRRPFPNTRIKIFNAERVQIRSGLTDVNGRLQITLPPAAAPYTVKISHANAFGRRFPTQTSVLNAPVRGVNGVAEVRHHFCTGSGRVC